MKLKLHFSIPTRKISCGLVDFSFFFSEGGGLRTATRFGPSDLQILVSEYY